MPPKPLGKAFLRRPTGPVQAPALLRRCSPHAGLAHQEMRGKDTTRAEDPGAQIEQGRERGRGGEGRRGGGDGHHFLTESPFPAEPVEFAWPLLTLTTVLLIRVVFAVIVAVTHPGASDALAIVTVEVQRGAGRQRWVQEKGRVRREGYTGPETLAPNPTVLIPIPGPW